jgi:hypothetical protein
MFDDGVAAAGGSGAVAAEESNFAKAMVHKWLAIIWNDLGDIDGTYRPLLPSLPTCAHIPGVLPDFGREFGPSRVDFPLRQRLI